MTSFWISPNWNKFSLCSLVWNVDKLIMQKGSINVVSLSHFEFRTEYFLKQSAWIFSTRSLSRCFWASLAYVWKRFVFGSINSLSTYWQKISQNDSASCYVFEWYVTALWFSMYLWLKRRNRRQARLDSQKLAHLALFCSFTERFDMNNT